MVSMGLLIAIVHSHGFLMGETTGMLTRITMTSAIYSKASWLGILLVHSWYFAPYQSLHTLG